MLGEVEVVHADELLGLVDAALGWRDRLVLLVVFVVVLGLGGVARLAERLQLHRHLLADHLLGQAGEGVIGVGRLLGASRDDQRRPRLVDENVVDLVDDRERVLALDALLQAGGHVVAQVVEAELGVGPERDVAGVCLAPLRGRHLRLDHADGDAEEVVHRLHPHRVASRQVVVNGDEVDALAAERVEEDGGGTGEGLAFAGLHLGDRAGVKNHASDQLHVVVALADRALARLASERERFGQNRVECLVVLADVLAELVGALADLGVVEQLELGLESVDLLDPLLVFLQLAALAEPQRFVDQSSSRHQPLRVTSARSRARLRSGFAAAQAPDPPP